MDKIHSSLTEVLNYVIGFFQNSVAKRLGGHKRLQFCAVCSNAKCRRPVVESSQQVAGVKSGQDFRARVYITIGLSDIGLSLFSFVLNKRVNLLTLLLCEVFLVLIVSLAKDLVYDMFRSSEDRLCPHCVTHV